MNWATLACGAAVISVSSEVAGCEAHHALTDDLSQIWLSDTGIPQWLCISLQNVTNYQNIEIRTVGWHCWHSYSTNPREVRIHVSRDGAKFRIWDTVSAALQHQGTQLFCCAPISVALYPFIAFEILTTYGGPQTYMNRIYLYSDEFSSDSVASVSDYERSSLNITMGGIKSADTSTIGDEDSRFDDIHPSHQNNNMSLIANRQPQYHPNNVSADILDPSRSSRPPFSTRMPSTIKQRSPQQLRDEYAAVLHSYDAYSQSLKSLNEDTTVLVERLSKALAIEGEGSTESSSIPSEDARAISALGGTLIPRDGGISPRSSILQNDSRVNNPRLWESDTAALLSRNNRDYHDTTNVNHSMNNSIFPAERGNILSTTQLRSQVQLTDTSQRVESLLSSHDGQLFYSSRKPTVSSQAPITTSIDRSSTSLASTMNIPQKDLESILLTTSLQSQQSLLETQTLQPLKATLSSNHIEGIDSSAVLRLSSNDIDHRLKNLENKFSTIVGLLEKNSKSSKNEVPSNDQSKTKKEDNHHHGDEGKNERKGRSRSHSRSRNDDYHKKARQLSRSKAFSRSRSRSPSQHKSNDQEQQHSRSHSSHSRSHKKTSKRDHSRSRSRSKSRHHSQHHRPSQRSIAHKDQEIDYFSSDDEKLYARVSPSRDRFEMNSLSSTHSKLKHNTHPAAAASFSTNENSPSSQTSDHGGTVISTTSSVSSVLKQVLGKQSGEGVDQLVSRILREVKENGHLSEHAAATLRHQTLNSVSLPISSDTTTPADYIDLLPSAKADLAAAAEAAASPSPASRSRDTLPLLRQVSPTRSVPSQSLIPTSSTSANLLSGAAQSVLDQRVMYDEAANVAVQRVLDRRYPFPTTSISSSNVSNLSTKLSSLQQQTDEIEGRHVRSHSPIRPTSSAHSISVTNKIELTDEEDITLRIDRLVKDLHHCVLQKTVKEAQLRLLLGENPISSL